MKLWFGVSKFASTSSLVYTVEWEKASDLVRTSHETRTSLGPVSMSWLSNGLHDLFFNPDSVIYLLKGVCVCKLCNSPACHKSHIIHCRWATKDEPFDL